MKVPAKRHLFRAAILVGLCVTLLLMNEQAGSWFGKSAPGAGSRAARSSYYLVDCPNDDNKVMRFVYPLPDSRYFYSDRYGWFDETHFDAGNPAQVIADVEAAATTGGGIITISQSVRDGITGYTAQYLVSGDVNPGEVIGVALGIYMDWSTRFEEWQGSLPRNIVGPFTPFSIEDLPTQYIGFMEDATHQKREVIFTCYLGQIETADAPPHLWVSTEPGTPTDGPDLPDIKRLTNRRFEPLVLTENGWEHVAWPSELRLNPLPSGSTTWLFDADETWYLDQAIP
ncbi:MAG: hypothetical protein IPM53_07420 [Anaerolineaceae bacterium]|nr:hypothetical protein [Anaerolineaceae bacterium]